MTHSNNMMARLTAVLALFCGTLSVMSQTADDSVYVFKQDQADAGYYLPAPPDSASMDFSDDMIQWQWGKSQRPTPRGEQASRESLWLPEMMRTVMAEVLELDTISDELTPALSRLLVKSYWTGEQSVIGGKEKYMRMRPFVRMGEQTWAQYDTDFLRTNGSYPSGHTSFGWATALVFAEMWPELQDTILRRGFQFGENRIITGAHWQSDVNAGFLCAAASIARAHTNPELIKDIEAARAEYAQMKGLPADYDPSAAVEFPVGSRILNEPVDTASYRYVAELMRYWQGKALRSTERGQQAFSDCDNSVLYLASTFGDALGIEISEAETPALWNLITRIKADSKTIVSALKDTYFRKRPYVQLGEETLSPDREEANREESSFPSGHSCLGWSLALALTEVVPDRQDEVLKRGFDYGYSRLISGYHWATDVEAARLLACSLIARLHADTDFRQALAAAREEYEGISVGITAPEASTTQADHGGSAYRLDGVPASPATRGIVVSQGRKQVINH